MTAHDTTAEEVSRLVEKLLDRHAPKGIRISLFRDRKDNVSIRHATGEAYGRTLLDALRQASAASEDRS